MPIQAAKSHLSELENPPRKKYPNDRFEFSGTCRRGFADISENEVQRYASVTRADVPLSSSGRLDQNGVRQEKLPQHIVSNFVATELGGTYDNRLGKNTAVADRKSVV